MDKTKNTRKKRVGKFLKKVNQYIFCHPTSYSLKKPLGKWKQTKYPQNSWNHFYDPTQNRLLKYHNITISPWTFHRPTTNNSSVYSASEGMPTEPPPIAHKITITSKAE